MKIWDKIIKYCYTGYAKINYTLLTGHDKSYTGPIWRFMSKSFAKILDLMLEIFLAYFSVFYSCRYRRVCFKVIYFENTENDPNNVDHIF